jgi:hypothetical protein
LSSSSDDSTPVKSIFEGASKYDILNYLEDARERGLTDCDLGDLEEEQEEEQDHGEPPEVGGAAGIRDISVADPDPGSGIRCLFDPCIRDLGWVKKQDPDPG